MADVPTITLNDGTTIPQFGFGVYQVPPEETAETVAEALKVGYRHVDTAEMYRNEQGVGEAIEQSGLGRESVHVTSKLNNGAHAPDDARAAFEESVTKIGGYIDLFIIHWPTPNAEGSDYLETWKTMLEFKDDGRARSVGVSNFEVDHLRRITDETGMRPSVNQIEVHPYFQNREVVAYCQEHDIAIEAWSPIAQGAVLDDPVITEIADAHGKTAAQVTLRWHIQKGYIVFPKSSTPERIRENFEIFDFELSDDDMSKIDGLDKGEDGRTGPNPNKF